MADGPPRHPCGLFEAAWRLASDQEDGRQFATLMVRYRSCSGGNALTLDELQWFSDLQMGLEAELLSKLVKGELVATWFPPGRTSPEPIHPDWWRRARVDLWLSQAQVCETVISGIGVSPATSPKPYPIERVERTGKTSIAESAEADCAVWLKQAWPQSKATKKPDWFKQAQQKWSGLLSEDAFNRAWAAAAKEHSGMSRRGRPAKKMVL